MDDILIKRREVFFNNLVLLGLDRLSFEKKYGIRFHKDMFVLPNKKGYEVVTHFLFSKLNAATGKDYNLPWPLLDKEYDRMFQKTCYTHLMNFSEENLVKFPRIVPSVISTFGGDRFYEVYLALSSYVLSKRIRKNGNINLLSRPTVTQENFAAAKQNLQLATILCIQKFRETENFTHHSHLIWTTFSKNLQKCLHQLKQSLDLSEDLLKKKHAVISSMHSDISGENVNIKQMIETSFECWKPLIKQRKSLEKFFSSEKKYWNYLASEVGENVENEVFNGQDFNICITDNLSGECCKKLEKVGFTTSQEDGKLCVLRFMKLFMAYIICIAELLNKNSLSELCETSLVEDATSIQDDLSSSKILNKKFSEEIIPEVEENIKRLKCMHCFDDPKEDIEVQQICTSLPVLSFNPENVMERMSYFNTQLLPEREKFCSQDTNDSVFLREKNSTSELSFMNKNNISIPDSPFLIDDVTRTIPNVKSFASNQGVSSERIHSRKVNVPSIHFQATSSKLNVSDLEDIDFAPSNNFKMRKSWLNEECLNSVTLPDISFDE